MPECWLRPNRRALSLGLAMPLLLLLAGIAFQVLAVRDLTNWFYWGLAWTLMLVGVTMAAMLLYFMSMPRLAYDRGKVLAFLGSSQPAKIPAEIVECFFLGQSATKVGAGQQESETATIVVRLAEAAKDWHHRDVKPALGRWCEGYITIHGTWCEPITAELLQRMNRRLAEVHREQRTEQTSEGPP